MTPFEWALAGLLIWGVGAVIAGVLYDWVVGQLYDLDYLIPILWPLTLVILILCVPVKLGVCISDGLYGIRAWWKSR